MEEDSDSTMRVSKTVARLVKMDGVQRKIIEVERGRCVWSSPHFAAPMASISSLKWETCPKTDQSMVSRGDAHDIDVWEDTTSRQVLLHRINSAALDSMRYTPPGPCTRRWFSFEW
jgi:hypothetical protein